MHRHLVDRRWNARVDIYYPVLLELLVDGKKEWTKAGAVVERTNMSDVSEHAGACAAPCDASQAHKRAETPWLASVRNRVRTVSWVKSAANANTDRQGTVNPISRRSLRELEDSARLNLPQECA